MSASVITEAEYRDPIRIYVACLAAYNNGHLHGSWIDAAQGESHIWKQTRAMLKASPIPQAEEWAIHDYEGFGGISVGEYEGFKSVIAYADFILEHGELGAALIAHFGNDVQEATQAMERYCGAYKSLADYAEQITDDCYGIPESLTFYFDYERMARDMENAGDMFTIDLGGFSVHVFWGA